MTRFFSNPGGGEVPINFMMQSESGLHVAIILDGNGRWAARRGLPRAAGHRAGAAALQRTVEAAPEAGIRTLTVYAFSSDNWRRPAEEVKSIFWLLRRYLRMETERMRQRGVRLKVIGRRDRLPYTVVKEIERAEEATVEGRRIELRIAVDYSSREAIARAAAAGCADGAASPDALKAMVSQELTGNCGDVDLLIRTGGEKRLSDFLLWELAYAELLFTDTMWPEFDGAKLRAAVEEFYRRERRFGGVPVDRARDAVLLGQAERRDGGCSPGQGEQPGFERATAVGWRRR